MTSSLAFFKVLSSEEFRVNQASRVPADLSSFFALVLPYGGPADGGYAMVYCLHPGQLDFLRHRELDATIILFRPEFLCPLRGEPSLAIDSGLFCAEEVKTVVIPLLQRPEIDFIIAHIQREYLGQALLNSEALYSMLKVLLIELIRLAGLENLSTRLHNSDDRIASQFMELVDRYYLTAKNVAFYAEKLRVGPNYLNIKVKQATGRTASNHIHQRIVLEAKRKAQWDYMSLKEVAYCLGFTDISYFSRFFKKVAGMSYTDFKRMPTA